MMDCRECDALLDRWEEGAGEEGLDLESLASHIGGCPRCGPARRALLPLLLAGREEGDPPAPSPAARRLADAVMLRLEAGGDRPSLPRGAEARGAAARREAPSLAAAAILALGIGLGLFFGLRDPGAVTVTFVLEAPEASTVALAGDFTGWNAEGWDLRRAKGSGPWERKVRLRKGGLYAYNFIVDGERWIPDPSVPETLDDGFGGASSLLRL